MIDTTMSIVRHYIKDEKLIVEVESGANYFTRKVDICISLTGLVEIDSKDRLSIKKVKISSLMVKTPDKTTLDNKGKSELYKITEKALINLYTYIIDFSVINDLFLRMSYIGIKAACKSALSNQVKDKTECLEESLLKLIREYAVNKNGYYIVRSKNHQKDAIYHWADRNITKDVKVTDNEKKPIKFFEIDACIDKQITYNNKHMIAANLRHLMSYKPIDDVNKNEYLKDMLKLANERLRKLGLEREIQEAYTFVGVINELINNTDLNNRVEVIWDGSHITTCVQIVHDRFEINLYEETDKGFEVVNKINDPLDSILDRLKIANKIAVRRF